MVDIPDKVRLYDKDGFSLRGACVVWDSPQKNTILLIKNKKNKWGLPGGGIEKYDNCFQEGALRELKEEAGIIGKVTSYLGNYKDIHGKKKHNTFVWDVIPLEELEDYKENYRERKWFSFKEAFQILNEKSIHQNIIFDSKKRI